MFFQREPRKNSVLKKKTQQVAQLILQNSIFEKNSYRLILTKRYKKMKNNIYLCTLLIIGALLFSCEKNDLDFESDYGKSYQAWLDFKQSSDNSYSYTVARSSWAGPAWETTLTISGGMVIMRNFRYTSMEGLSENFPEENLEWVEHENELNTHGNSPASEALTLSEVYQKAQNEWLVKRENVQTFFQAENQGLISLCGYVENGCQDDCFTGIRIVSVEPLLGNK